MRKWYKKYMFVVGTLGQFLFYAQFYKILQHKNAQDVSFAGFVSSFISIISWLIYGLMLHDKPIIISNIVRCIGVFLVIIAILIYQ